MVRSLIGAVSYQLGLMDAACNCDILNLASLSSNARVLVKRLSFCWELMPGLEPGRGLSPDVWWGGKVLFTTPVKSRRRMDQNISKKHI
jgi:hypothetical protein